MSPASPPHPSADQLTAYALGRLSDEETAFVAEHLSKCGECQAIVEAVPDDAFAALFHAGPPGSPGEGTSFGDYELLEKIGGGGNGVVFRARQRSLNRVVALKVLGGGPLTSGEQVRRFLKEAETIASLAHPGIVRVFHVGMGDNRFFYTMELMEGGDLSKLMDTERRPMPRTAAELLVKIADAVQYAHRRDVLHRDLKPSNVLLDAQGRLYVGDFGLAKLLPSPGREIADGTLTRSGTLLGTPGYMAPEQAFGDRREVGTPADVYGLGAILYALLTGRAPFIGSDPLAVLEQVRDRTPDSPRRLNPAVDRDLETICLKCLRKEPANRYESAQAFADDLTRFLNGEPIRARRVGIGERALRWCRRNRLVAGMSCVLALVLIASVIGLSASVVRLNREIDEKGKALRTAENKEEAERQLAYPGDMLEAHQAWFNLQPDETRRLLGRHAPADGKKDVRGFEWHYLHRLSQVGAHGARSFGGMGGRIYALAFLRGGAEILVTTGDQRIRRWDRLSGDLLAEHDSINGEGGWIAVAPDGRTVALAALDSSVRIRDGLTWELLATIPASDDVIARVEFSPNGKFLVAGDYTARVSLIDVKVKTVIFQEKVHSRRIFFVCFGPDGKTLYSGAECVKAWNIVPEGESVTLTERFSTQVDGGGGDSVLSPDGRLLIVPDENGFIHTFDAITGKALPDWGTEFAPHAGVRFSPDGRILGTATPEGGLRFWDVASRSLIGESTAHTARITQGTFAPDGTAALTGGYDGMVRLHPTPPPDASRLFAVGATAPTSLMFAHDDSLVIGAGEEVSVWNARTWERRGVRSVRPGAIFAISPDGQTVASIDGDGIALWPIGDPSNRLNEWKAPDMPISVLAFDGTGEHLLTGANGAEVLRWNVKTGERDPLPPVVVHEDEKPHWQSLVIDRQGRHFAAVDDVQGVWLFDLKENRWRPPLSSRRPGVSCLAFSPDGNQLAAGNRDGSARLYDLGTGKEVGLLNHTAAITGVAFSPDGHRLATEGGHAVKLWQVPENREVCSLAMTPGYDLRAVAFSPDGRMLVAGGKMPGGKGIVQVWYGAEK
jgi:eukaryotic-like serine/threonine-protein kinase